MGRETLTTSGGLRCQMCLPVAARRTALAVPQSGGRAPSTGIGGGLLGIGEGLLEIGGGLLETGGGLLGGQRGHRTLSMTLGDLSKRARGTLMGSGVVRLRMCTPVLAAIRILTLPRSAISNIEPIVG